jgi:hypothetical protein
MKILMARCQYIRTFSLADGSWFRTAILSSPFYNMIVPIFLSKGDDTTVPSSYILALGAISTHASDHAMQHAGMIQHHHACLDPKPTLVHQSSHHLMPNKLSIFPNI